MGCFDNCFPCNWASWNLLIEVSIVHPRDPGGTGTPHWIFGCIELKYMHPYSSGVLGNNILYSGVARSRYTGDERNRVSRFGPKAERCIRLPRTYSPIEFQKPKLRSINI